MKRSTRQNWTVQRSEELYALPSWGLGLFRLDPEGRVMVTPNPNEPERGIVISRLLEDLQRRGIHPPLLLRFNDILRRRVYHLFDCFARSIREYGYRGRYQGVYPIKVNQQRHVVETLLHAGQEHGLGLEIGSKPELLAAIALLERRNSLLICNGSKDRDFLRTALWARRLGRECIVVAERFAEVRDLLDVAEQEGITPMIGLRAKLATRGAGRWESSGGERSKFGLDASDLVRAIELLRERGKLDCLRLLHFHIGSQITGIANLKRALREGARMYVELAQLGAPLGYFDVGGGLGVDYDGTRSSEDISIDYSDQEYANDVVWETQRVCDEAGVEHPHLISESGRALVAHETVLVVDVTESSEDNDRSLPEIPKNAPRCLLELSELLLDLDADRLVESYHDAQTLKEEVRTLFNHGVLDLRQRAHGEDLARAVLKAIREHVRGMQKTPQALTNLERELSEIYYCNFSLFQSLPDHWAIEHRFPVMPLSGLDRPPTHEVTLADLTCDSDGKVDSFIGGKTRCTLPVPALSAGPLQLGFFLVGAYQEILGDLHNLFGDTSAVHVELREGGLHVAHVVEADRNADVLGFVGYSRAMLLESLRQSAENAVREGRMSLEESATLLRRYSASLESSTYPEETTSELTRARGL